MSGPVEVCRADELPLGSAREVVIGDRVVAVYHTDSGIWAIDAICPHAGGPLAQGMVRRDVVTCPWHGWQFHVPTGCHQLNSRIKVETFAVRIENGAVIVDLSSPAAGQ